MSHSEPLAVHANANKIDKMNGTQKIWTYYIYMINPNTFQLTHHNGRMQELDIVNA